MPARLKVFQAHLGFFDTVVAAPSRAAALKAWGSRQNLFRDGQAKEAAAAEAIAAALAKPGIVLRRPVGTNVAFSENPGLPHVPKAPRNAPEKKSPDKKPAPLASKPKTVSVAERCARSSPPTPPQPPPDRRALDAAEKALGELKCEEERVLATLAKRKAALDEEELRARNAFHARRKRAEEQLAKARNDYVDKLRR
jgi:hypothetical protein